MKAKYLPIAVAAVVLSGCCSQKHKQEGINGLTYQQIRELTVQAYIMSFPLIMNYESIYSHAVDSLSAEYTGGFGKVCHNSLYDPDDPNVVLPDNDTLHSRTWLDLRSEPWVIVMPDADPDHFYTSQCEDLWGFVIDSSGSIADRQGGGAYLIAPLDWNGVIPAEVKRVIRSESYFTAISTHTTIGDYDDPENVQKTRAVYDIMPLHEYAGQAPPEPAGNIQWIPFVPGDETTVEAFKYVNLMLQYTIQHEPDKPALDSMAKLGIKPGLEWDTLNFSAKTKKAIQDGIWEAIETMEGYKLKANLDGLFNTRETLKTNYTARALNVMLNIGEHCKDTSCLSSGKRIQVEIRPTPPKPVTGSNLVRNIRPTQNTSGRQQRQRTRHPAHSYP